MDLGAVRMLIENVQPRSAGIVQHDAPKSVVPSTECCCSMLFPLGLCVESWSQGIEGQLGSVLGL